MGEILNAYIIMPTVASHNTDERSLYYLDSLVYIQNVSYLINFWFLFSALYRCTTLYHFRHSGLSLLLSSLSHHVCIVHMYLDDSRDTRYFRTLSRNSHLLYFVCCTMYIDYIFASSGSHITTCL